MDKEPIVLEKKDFDLLTDKLKTAADEKINSLFKEAEKGNVEALNELKAKVGELSKVGDVSTIEFLKNVQDHVNNVEKQLKESQIMQAKGMTMESMLIKQLESKRDDLINAHKSGKAFEFEMKAATDMSVTDNVGAGVMDRLFLPGITPILKRNPALYDILNKIPWQRDIVYYNQIASEEGAPTSVKEDAASIGDATARLAAASYPKKEYNIENKTMTLQKIGVHTKITLEMIENIPDFVSWIRNEVLMDVLLKLDTDILTGNGTAPNIKGLQHSDYYTAAAIPSDYTLPSGITPNEAQVLRAILTQQRNGYSNSTAILMHPTDSMKLDLAVDENGTPVIYPFAGRDNTNIKGVPIVEVPTLTAGTFHVIDATRIALYVQRALNIRIFDQNEDDAIHDRQTMVCSVKAAPLVKSNYKISNIYGTFSTLITAMTAGS